MKVLVTGGAGFLGSRLIQALLDGKGPMPRVDAVVSADLAPCPIADARVSSRVGSVADPLVTSTYGAFVATVVTALALPWLASRTQQR